MNLHSPIWHPMTQHALSNDAIHVDRAEGAYLYEKGRGGREGRAILDAISSWWVITHGHCHPDIVKAVKAQAGKLEQVIFAGFTHDPAEGLAKKLLSILPDRHKHIFFSDSGSTAVEVALKMAMGYFEHTGVNAGKTPKRKIVALDGGYHGDTFGAMAAGGRSVFNKLYEPYLFEVTHLPFPESGQEDVCISTFLSLCREGDVAVLILEPLIQGAAGMRVYSKETLKSLADICKAHGVLLIADEVMTGFGRTGTRFACEQAEVVPDIVCLSKGLTGGFLPMGATACTSDIYKAFYKKDRAKMFFHSTSFSGNPLACAAALANLEIWDEEPVFEKIEAITAAHQTAAQWFSTRPDVAEVRTIGTIFAVDIAVDAEDEAAGYLSSLAPKLYDFYLSQDVLLRPMGNTVYILPPYCVTQDELDRIYDTIWRSLDFIRDERKQRAA